MKNLILISILALTLLVACTGQNLPQLQSTACSDGQVNLNGACVKITTGSDLFTNKDFSNITWKDTELPVYGFIARPNDDKIYPGVVMIHEWWGLNDNIKEMAKILAREGYVVYAVDLYDGKLAANSTEAREYSGEVRANPDVAIEKLGLAVDYLKTIEGASKVASLGWCFGGGQSLQLSLNEKLDATVIYYGTLVENKTLLSSLDGPVLGIFGSNDTSIPLTSVNAFDSLLDELNIKNEIYIYDGRGHAFANPTGANYAPEDTVDAWNKTINFLDENLKNSAAMIPEPVPVVPQPILEPVMNATSNQSMKYFEVSGKNFAFFMDGVESPELRVREGDLVKIKFINEDGFHDFVLDEFDVKTESLGTGENETIEFIADKKGTFEYYCSVGSHRQMGMKGNFIVE